MSYHDDIRDLQIRADRRRPGQDPADAFTGEGLLSGKPMLKLVQFLNDDELAEAAAYPDDVRTLLGSPVNARAREEIERRKKAHKDG